ncbi:MAG: nickel-binding protein [Thermoanaerobaculia bacterium]
MSDAAKKIDKCLEEYGARWIRSYVSKDRKRIICEFEAADAEQVRASYRNAGVKFESCWSADVFARENPGKSY